MTMSPVTRAFYKLGLIAGMFISLPAAATMANTVEVAPQVIEITAPEASAFITLRNPGTETLNLQFSVFTWIQADGVESVEPANVVVVSSDAAQIAAGAEYSLQIERVGADPVAGEEAFQLLIEGAGDTAIWIPIFFTTADASDPVVTAALYHDGENVFVRVQNSGETRLEVAEVSLNRMGEVLASHEGLLGHVLGNSTMEWAMGPLAQIGTDRIRLELNTNIGVLNYRIDEVLAR